MRALQLQSVGDACFNNKSHGREIASQLEEHIMATAIESDGEQHQVQARDTEKQEKAMLSSSGSQGSDGGRPRAIERPPGSSHNTGFSLQDLCCTVSSSYHTLQQVQTERKGGVTMECNRVNTAMSQSDGGAGVGTNFSQDSHTSTCSSSSPMVPLLSEYYSHIIAIQKEMERLSVPPADLRASLQESPCLIDSSERQPLFKCIHSGDDLSSLLSFLQDQSSWYNHSLLSYMTQLHTGGACKGLIDAYNAVLDQYSSHKLLLLPALSTGPKCPEGFEELHVFTSDLTESFTLGEAVSVQELVQEVLGIRKHVALLQGVLKVKSGMRGGRGGGEGSMFLFWIPSSVASVCLSKATSNVNSLMGTSITRIEGMYGATIHVLAGKEKPFLVTTSPSHPHQPVRRYQMDSGFAENHGSSDNLLFSSSSPFSNIITNFTISDDEVFITPVYSDTSSSTHAHYSIETSNVSSNSSIIDRSNDDNNGDDDEETISNQSLNSLADFPRCSTPVIAPPPGYDDASIRSESGETPSVISSSLQGEVGGVGEKGGVGDDLVIGRRKVKVIDSEILREIDRQNNHEPSTAAFSTPTHDQRSQEEASMREDKIPLSKKLSSESTSTYIKMGSAQAHYITSPLRAQLVTTSKPTSEAMPNRGIPQTTPFGSELRQYVIAPSMEVNGFVKRILLRGCDSYPAQLHMVGISRQEEGKGMLPIKAGQKLLARYLKDQYIIATDIATNQTGKLLYSSARVSRSYYGNNSKVSTLSYSHLYSFSTLNIKHIVDNQDGFRQFQPIKIDLVVIKGYTSQDRDEMTVAIGNRLRLLYGDERWVYASSVSGKAGFVPRSHCRLVRQSYNTLRTSGWLHSPSTQFQSDFCFNTALPLPSFLSDNPHLPQSKKKGEICSLLGNYTVPGTQQMVRKGCNVKLIYSEMEGHYYFVATISGLRFWVPAAFLTVARRGSILPTYLRRSSEDLRIGTARLRPKSHTISGQEYRGKKVSFALQNQMAIIHSARSSLCQSNPELSQEPQYSTIGSSNLSQTENDSTPTPQAYPNFFYFDDNSPSDQLCCKFFCF